MKLTRVLALLVLIALSPVPALAQGGGRPERTDYKKMRQIHQADVGTVPSGWVFGPFYNIDLGKWQFKKSDGTFADLVDGVEGAGTVTSVGITPPNIFSVSGGPITDSGTFVFSLTDQPANFVWAGPTTGADADPAFRALVSADIPNLAASKITSGVFDVARLGTGTADSSKYLNGAGEWTTFPAGGGSLSVDAGSGTEGVLPVFSATGVADSPLSVDGSGNVVLADNKVFAAGTGGRIYSPAFGADFAGATFLGIQAFRYQSATPVYATMDGNNSRLAFTNGGYLSFSVDTATAPDAYIARRGQDSSGVFTEDDGIFLSKYMFPVTSGFDNPGMISWNETGQYTVYAQMYTDGISWVFGRSGTEVLGLECNTGLIDVYKPIKFHPAFGDAAEVGLYLNMDSQLQVTDGTTFGFGPIAPASVVLPGLDTGRVTIQASPTSSTSYTFTLPDDAGTDGQVLATDGEGSTYWTDAGAGGGSSFDLLSETSDTVVVDGYLKAGNNQSVDTAFETAGGALGFKNSSVPIAHDVAFLGLYNVVEANATSANHTALVDGGRTRVFVSAGSNDFTSAIRGSTTEVDIDGLTGTVDDVFGHYVSVNNATATSMGDVYGTFTTLTLSGTVPAVFGQDIAYSHSSGTATEYIASRLRAPSGAGTVTNYRALALGAPDSGGSPNTFYSTITPGDQTATYHYVLPIDTPSANEVLTVDAISGSGPYTVTLEWAAAATIAGSSTQVFFNDSGAMGADSGFVFNKTTDVLTVAGAVSTPTIEGVRTKTLTEGSATGFVTLDIPSDTAIGGTIEYTIKYASGGQQEIASGVLLFVGTNEGGTELGGVTVQAEMQLPAATMTTTFDVTTGTNNMTIRVNSSSTALTASPVISYRVHSNSGSITVTGL